MAKVEGNPVGRSAVPDGGGPNRRGKRWWGWLKLLLGVSILGFLLARASPEAVMTALKSSGPGSVAAALGLALAAQLPAALRLRLFAGALGLHFSALRLAAINLAAAFYGLFLPGGNVTAGAVRMYRMSRLEGRPARTLLAVVRDRLDSTAALVAVGLLFLLADASSDTRVTGLLLAALLGCGATFGVLTLSGRVACREGRTAAERTGPGLVGTVRKALAETGRMPAGAQARAFALSLGAQLPGVLAYFLLAGSVGVDLPLVTLGWIRSAVMLATMVPLSLGGIGVREGAFLLLLGPFGVSQEATLALSLLVFATTVASLATVGGLLEAGGLLAGGVGDVRGRPSGPTERSAGARDSGGAGSDDAEGG